MPASRRVTRESIIKEAMTLVSRQGAASVTFQAIASALGVSKQAIIYWYPTKWELIADICLPLMREEADSLVPAVSAAAGARDAIDVFVRTFVAHYIVRLPQFRLLYLPQSFGVIEPNAPDQQAALAPVHRITSSVYSALEGKIASDTDFLPQLAPRRVAVAVHMAGVGLITMFAAADALGDPMVHAPDAMVDAMVAVLTAQKAEAPRRRTHA